MGEPLTASTAIATGAATAAGAAGGLALSKAFAVGLGYAVLAGSLFRSVPQIIKVLRAGSCEGLSLMSNAVELLCYTVVLAYNISQGYAFNTFGEVFACWLQDIILVGLICHYARAPALGVGLAAAGFAILCAWLLSPACPPGMLALLQACTIASMALGSRLPQILLNIRRGNSGMLSVTTCLLNVAGNSARTFTTLVLTGDYLILGGVLTQGCLNSVLLWQSLQTARARRAAAAASGVGAGATPSQQTAAVEAAAAPINGFHGGHGAETAAGGSSAPGTAGSCGPAFALPAPA